MKICSRLKKGLHFSQNSIRACCSTVLGPIFESHFNNGKIDFDKMLSMRKELVFQFEQGIIPDCCKDCSCCNEEMFISEKNDYKINTIQFNHYNHCNCSCVYCNNTTFKQDVTQSVKKSTFYDVMPYLRELEEKNLLDDNLNVLITGGEPTCLYEFDDILEFFENKNAFIIVFSSGIKFNQKIADLIHEKKLRLVVSLDCGCSETYKKIKRINKYSEVIKNLEKYSKAGENHKNSLYCPVLKYIFLEGINDNTEEIDKFFEVVNQLQVPEVQPDFNNSPLILSHKMPENYDFLFSYFVEKASKLNLRCDITERLKNCLTSGYYV